MANFEHEEGGAVNALAFSENGYYMASAGEDGYARLWDLRKLNNFQKLAIGAAPGAASSVAFDYSGSYLAVGGKDCAKVKTTEKFVKSFIKNKNALYLLFFTQKTNILKDTAVDVCKRSIF